MELWSPKPETFPLPGTPFCKLHLKPPSSCLCLELWNLLDLLGYFCWNLGTTLGTSWILYLEPLLLGTWRNLHLEPLLGTLELLGSFTETLILGTSEPRGTLRDDCPRVPHIVWLRPKLSAVGEKHEKTLSRSVSPEVFSSQIRVAGIYRTIHSDKLVRWLSHRTIDVAVEGTDATGVETHVRHLAESLSRASRFLMIFV